MTAELEDIVVYNARAADRPIRSRSGTRLLRVGVYHRAAFRELLETALTGQQCLRRNGAYWAPLLATRTFGIYRRAPDQLVSFQETVERYELVFYGSLLRGACGRDGVLRPRTHLCRRSGGALRALDSLSGGMDDG